MGCCTLNQLLTLHLPQRQTRVTLQSGLVRSWFRHAGLMPQKCNFKALLLRVKSGKMLKGHTTPFSIHMYVYTHVHTCTHACMRMHSRTNTHMHAQVPASATWIGWLNLTKRCACRFAGQVVTPNAAHARTAQSASICISSKHGPWWPSASPPPCRCSAMDVLIISSSSRRAVRAWAMANISTCSVRGMWPLTMLKKV